MEIKYMFDRCKLNIDKKKMLESSVDKLEGLLNVVDLNNKSHNPAFHDVYDKNFYAFKNNGHKFSIRILYKLTDDNLEIHDFYFKCGKKNNTNYINCFENYVRRYCGE